MGDLVRITEQAPAFPADVLLLQSSTHQGLCNIETANLDGETKLKIKQALGATYALPTDASSEHYLFNTALQFKLESEAPSENISKWQGALYLYPDVEEVVAVGMQHRLGHWLRGGHGHGHQAGAQQQGRTVQAQQRM